MRANLQGCWALVTGASSGFGNDYCHLLAARGCHLVMVARRAEAMQILASTLRAQYGISIEIIPTDLTQAGAAAELFRQTEAAGIRIDILINNAGAGLFGKFTDQTLSKTLEMLQLNMVCVTELTYLYAQQMQQRRAGHILLVSSIAAFQPLPGYAAYSGSKAYILLFGEALHEELKPSGVHLTVLAPGISATAFFEVAGQKDTWYHRLVKMKSRTVAAAGLDALFAGKSSVLPGWMNQLTVFLFRFLPRHWQSKIAGKAMQG
ncbi:SDR family NAD(P)-dependent oxidoreductase [Undibacterium griseum]|uniref:NADP-dependent 3-hydroxy acid dehydrogenase YdfG n=1 Tax=Undibacterium griseum TaxID=2762295 RepID=A0ABR6YJY3_9BURK|nr:SDR family oxidoreductase [Undibacterium griseum]MBC3884128.1 SDR family oxidoreductase [Undibacterium griseum]